MEKIRSSYMLSRLVLSVVVAVVVTLGCYLIGAILITLKVDIAKIIGDWLQTYGAALGILAGLWYFFAGGSFNIHRN
jgi:hypothetical protein